MAEPTTRAEFKENCLRRLGKPVIEHLDITMIIISMVLKKNTINML
jgi:hypothetical protein